MGWQSQPQQGGQCPTHPQSGGPQQQLSVVTTVWGVKTSNQSGPMPHNYANTNGPPTNGASSVTGVPYGGQSGHDGYSGCPSAGLPPQKSYQSQAITPRGQPGPYAGYVFINLRNPMIDHVLHYFTTISYLIQIER